LLLDGLMHEANRRLRMSIKFTTTYHSLPMKKGFVMWAALDALYPPHSPPNHNIIAQDLKHFLAKPVAKLEKNFISIKDVIKFEANVKGGVHVRNLDPNDPIELSLENFPLRERISEKRTDDKRPSLRQLDSIALVALDALEPLYNAICASA
jgi:hypothetical protein